MPKKQQMKIDEKSASKNEDIFDLEKAMHFPNWWLFMFRASGLYAGGNDRNTTLPERADDFNISVDDLIIPGFNLKIKDELRLDIDGRHPLMTASGRILAGTKYFVHWIASLKQTERNRYEGKIWYKEAPGTPFPYTHVRIDVHRSFYTNLKKATVTFLYGSTSHKREYRFKSSYFHPLSFEYDFAAGTTPITTIDTQIHPTHPSDLRQEIISIETVYRRAGFDVRTNTGAAIPLSMAGANQIWNDNELHDAMQIYWSSFRDAPQWAAWVIFAAEHEMGSGLAGIMFDDIGPNHRQGTAIFLDSSLFNADLGILQPDDWEERYKFWCACHEVGHCFNLAHSWQKDYSSFGSSWIPLSNNTASTSFMNYPFYYPYGPNSAYNSETDYFNNFEYRFDDEELLFMRHAPVKYVQPGNADWFDHHGFQQANTAERPALKLEVRANRKSSIFEFMEPIVLELKLTNISKQPIVIDDNLLSVLDVMTVIIKKDEKPARQFSPYAHYDFTGKPKVLGMGESAYESLFVSVGRNGWDLAVPGYYDVQVCLHLYEHDVVSNLFRLRITPPQEHIEELLAQDFFSHDVGRILTFDGSQAMEDGIDTLKEVSDRLKNKKVSYHADIALASSIARDYKRLKIEEPVRPFMPAAAAKGKIEVSKPDVRLAQKEYTSALTAKASEAAESLGHVDFKRYTDRFTDWLAEQGKKTEASDAQDIIYKTLKGRGVLKAVLDEIAKKRDRYKKKGKK